MNIFDKFYNDQMFDGINNITRWNNSRRIKDETVAHHSYLVTLFVNFIIERLCEDLYQVKVREDGYGYLKISDFKLKVLRAALMHDFDEITTGDVLYTVKNNEFNGEQLTKVLGDFVHYKINELLKNIPISESILFMESISSYDDKTIKSIVKVGDWLACIFYIYKERRLGNTCFDDRFETCKEQFYKWTAIAEQSLLSRRDLGFQDKDLKVLGELQILIQEI